MISKNIFLTGEKNIGKSTILERVLHGLGLKELDIVGFKTLPLYDNNEFIGFYMKAMGRCNFKNLHENIIGICKGENCVPRCIGMTQTFEGLGVDILDYSLASENSIVLLDELGFFEKDAYRFQEKIHEVLDSQKWAIGVIKPNNIEFLNLIRSRKDITIFEVSLENRDELPGKILNMIRGE